MKTLKKESEFKEVLRNGKKEFSAIGIMFKMPSDELSLGLITSKKIGSAVIRNKIRRRLRESIKEINNQTPIPAKIVLMPNKDAIKIVYKDLIKSIRKMIGNNQ